MTIMGVCVLVHVAKMFVADPGVVDLRFGFIPKHPGLLPLFTHMFLHGDIGHLLGNLFFFVVAGLKMEDALGHAKFFAFYLICGAAAAAGHAIMDSMTILPLIGASGAIAGVLGGFMMLYFTTRMKLLLIFFRLIAFEVPAWLYLTFWFGREVFYLVTSEGSGVAFGAHVGGFAFGALTTWCFFGWNRGEELDARALHETADVIYDAGSPA